MKEEFAISVDLLAYCAKAGLCADSLMSLFIFVVDFLGPGGLIPGPLFFRSNAGRVPLDTVRILS